MRAASTLLSMPGCFGGRALAGAAIHRRNVSSQKQKGDWIPFLAPVPFCPVGSAHSWRRFLLPTSRETRKPIESQGLRVIQ